MKELSDEELLQLFESGKIEAFNEIVMRYKDSLYNYLVKFTGGSPDCNDIVQEAFIQLYEYQKRTRDIKNFRAWIFRITINKARKISC
ncbi:MAG: RNA polymerase sigma factor [Ignavibacteria bacterium]|nr:RNA polymerase sigma factor [Ignavibacteria bacterium]